MSAMANAPWTLNDGGEDCQVLVYNPQLCVDNPSMSQELFESDVGNEDGLTPEDVHIASDNGGPSPLSGLFSSLEIKSKPADDDLPRWSPNPLDSPSPSFVANFDSSDASDDDLSWAKMFQEQLQVAAHGDSTASDTESLVSIVWSTRGVPVDGESYESDSSVTLAAASSPCPVGKSKTIFRHTGKRSAFFSNKTRRLSTPKKQRPSWLKTISQASDKRKRSPQHQTENMSALQHLKSLERSPTHRWTYEERRFLCILNRFYRRQYPDFALIFNHVHALDLPIRKVKDQFESYIRLHGARAFPQFFEVFVDTPFENNKFDDVHEQIEIASTALGLDVQRLVSEVATPSAGSAAKAKAPRTRQRFRQLARSFRHARPSSPKVPLLKFGGRAICVPDHQDEMWVDTEDRSSPLDRSLEKQIPIREISDLNPTLSSEVVSSVFSIKNLKLQSPVPDPGHQLALRVWDNDSYTTFSSNPPRFLSRYFSDLDDVCEPPPRESELFSCMAYRHFHLNSIQSFSPFVSVFVSLVSLFNLAAKKDYCTTQFSIIDLGHRSITDVKDKKTYGAGICRDLRLNGKLRWTRYKGLAEYLIWGDVPSEAILHVFTFADFEVFFQDHPAVAQFLHLESFTEKSTCSSAVEQLRRRNVTLTSDVSRVFGQLARFFQVSSPNHIRALVKMLIDGWLVTADDHEKMEDNARSFALVACPGASYEHLRKIEEGFILGFQDGTASIAKFSKRPRGLGRSRTT